MSREHKAFPDRERDLRLALARITHGRSKKGESKATIAAVAREAGVSAALIYNHYPAIADEVRAAQGRMKRDIGSPIHQECKAYRQKNRELRQELVNLRSKIAMLTSINESLNARNFFLESILRKNQTVEVLENPKKS